MRGTIIIASHNDTISSDISYSDSVVDYIVYCELDFYGVAEDDDDACDNTDKRTYLGSIKGYLILTHLMELMGESIYKVCDDHSGELETIMSIITRQGKREFDDVLYITEADIPDDVFGTIMTELPKVVMKHYHSYPELIVYYPKPSKNKAESEHFENIGFSKNLSSQAYAHVFSANFAADCVKNPCRATARLRIFALSATKLCSKIRTHFL